MKQKKPQFTREFDYKTETCVLKDSGGSVFFTVRLDELDTQTARDMCLQQFVRAVTEQATEAMRRGLPEAEAKLRVLAAHAKILAGKYAPRSGKSPNGTRKTIDGIKVTAEAAYKAGFRSVTHGGQSQPFNTPAEAYAALKWLHDRPADTDGVTGRMVYLDITKHPQVRMLAKPESVARTALGS